MVFFIALLFVHVSSFEQGAAKKEPTKVVEDTSEGSFQFALHHSLDGQQFTLRERVDLQFTSLASRPTAVTFSGFQFSDAQLSQFRELVKHNDFYRVRLVGSNGVQLHASVPACSLSASGYRESYVFNVDSYGNVASFEYRTPITSCSAEASIQKSPFQSKGRIALGRSGEKPLNLNSEQDRIEKATREKASPEAEKSFLSKYWMYLLPIGAVFLLQGAGGGASAPEGGGSGGGGGASAQS